MTFFAQERSIPFNKLDVVSNPLETKTEDNKEEQEYAINYFCDVLLKGDINESDSNQRQS